MAAWLAVLLQANAPVAPASARRLPLTVPGLSACADGTGEDIVVCGRRRDRYRLPLPLDRVPMDVRVHGEAADPLATITPNAPCGLFAGQRNCRKGEAARYGYGAGRDPVTLLTRLARKVADPDSEPDEPAQRP